MIAANELRIGNLVMYNGMVMRISEICSPKPLKEKRYSDKYLIELFDGAGLISCTIDEISAVSLTEDRILNFGFSVISENSAGKKYSYVIDGIFSSDLTFVFWTTTDRAGKFFRGDLEIKSVHQLQNLYFALTETELELNS